MQKRPAASADLPIVYFIAGLLPVYNPAWLFIAATYSAGNIGSRVFEGILRSDVICSSCGHVSTTQDPFTHLSMDIPPREQLVPLPILPRPSPILANSKCAAGTKAVPKVVTMEAKVS